MRRPNLTSWILAGVGSLAPSLAWAQEEMSQEDACAACAGGGALLFIVAAVIAVNIAILVWVARDAKARGVESPVLWVVLVLFTGLIGLVIYFVTRPKGDLVPCAQCGKKRLQTSAKCPHCASA